MTATMTSPVHVAPQCRAAGVASGRVHDESFAF